MTASLALAMNGARAAAPETSHRDPLYLVLLLDSSGSMRTTDPTENRKLAAQAAVTLLDPSDRVAVVDFDEEAHVLLDWTPATELATLFEAVQRAGQKGSFTDFRAALDAAREVLAEAPPASRRAVLLLSDGELQPNPKANAYGPLALEYATRMRGRSYKEQEPIYVRDYWPRLLPLARQAIETGLLPWFRDHGAEIFAVTFGKEADPKYFETLASATTRVPGERRSFHAADSGELIDVFTDLASYWGDTTKLLVHRRTAEEATSRTLPIDQFLDRVRVLIVAEPDHQPTLTPPPGRSAPRLPATHPALAVHVLNDLSQRSGWGYSVPPGTSPYSVLVLGRSTLKVNVTGLRPRYDFGEPIEAVVTVTGPDPAGALPLGVQSSVEAEVSHGEADSQHISLEQHDGAWRFTYLSERTGRVRLRFVLHAESKSGDPLLPRPTREHEVEVMPRFYVEPPFLTFGRVKRGSQATLPASIVSGLPGTRSVRIEAATTAASRCLDQPGRLPRISVDATRFEHEGRFDRPVKVQVEEGACWGVFEGTLRFAVETGEASTIRWRVHVPSLWEHATKAAVAVAAVLFAALLGLVAAWGRLGSPSGQLELVARPDDASPMASVQLGRIKHGLFRRHLNWRKHVLSVGGPGSDISLPGFARGDRLALVFYRSGTSYVRNEARRGTDRLMVLHDSVTGQSIERKPGGVAPLRDGLDIEIDGYRLRYHSA